MTDLHTYQFSVINSCDPLNTAIYYGLSNGINREINVLICSLRYCDLHSTCISN